MTTMTLQFQFDMDGNLEGLTNASDFQLDVYLKPVPPQRKLLKILVIAPKQFTFFPEGLPKLEYLTFSFTAVKKDE